MLARLENIKQRLELTTIVIASVTLFVLLLKQSTTFEFDCDKRSNGNDKMIAQLIAFISMFVAVLGDGHGDWENHDSMKLETGFGKKTE
ncbi:hypothetical protein ACF0H5_012556 [Mactra antiquata]